MLNAAGTLDRPERLPPDLERLRRQSLATYPAARPAEPTTSALALTVDAGRRRDPEDAGVRRAVAVMPMFPLGSVLLPGGVLPLHVFEPRYRQLVIDCLADDSGDPEFGVDDDRAGLGGRRRRRPRRRRRRRPDGPGRGARRRPVRRRRRRAPAGSGSTPGCPTTRTRWPTSTTGPTRRPTTPRWPAASPRSPTACARCSRWPPSSARRRTRRRPRRRSATTRCWRRYHLAALSPIGPADRYRLLCARVAGRAAGPAGREPRRRRGHGALPARLTPAKPAGPASASQRTAMGSGAQPGMTAVGVRAAARPDRPRSLRTGAEAVRLEPDRQPATAAGVPGPRTLRDRTLPRDGARSTSSPGRRPTSIAASSTSSRPTPSRRRSAR